VTSKDRKVYSKMFLFLWPHYSTNPLFFALTSFRSVPASGSPVSDIPRVSAANGSGFKWRKLNKMTHKVKPFCYLNR
jgi:hypothetical protein